MSWFQTWRQDVGRYTEYAGGHAFREILMQQGLWALFAYRLGSAISRSALPFWLRRPLLLMMAVWQKTLEVLTGISLPYSASIGPGLYIGHFGPVIVNGNAVIGAGCNLSQGVTVGVSGRGSARGVPVIGDRVYIGANAVVAGDIRIEDDVVIAANSLVTTDVPAGSTALGVPARVVNSNDSKDYLHPEDDA